MMFRVLICVGADLLPPFHPQHTPDAISKTGAFVINFYQAQIHIFALYIRDFIVGRKPFNLIVLILNALILNSNFNL
jgi:hypothetical protein